MWPPDLLSRSSNPGPGRTPRHAPPPPDLHIASPLPAPRSWTHMPAASREDRVLDGEDSYLGLLMNLNQLIVLCLHFSICKMAMVMVIYLLMTHK